MHKAVAIRRTFHRLGLQAKPKEIVQVLADQGIQVGEELVRQVRIEMLKETTDKKPPKVSRPMPTKIRRPQGFPRRGR
jgi:hypothetical protein